MNTVLVIGTFDTKGQEFAYLIDELQARGLATLSIDLGTQQTPSFSPDVTAAQVAQAAGSTLDDVRFRLSRAEALKVMAAGAVGIVKKLWQEKRFDGIMSMGGSQGTYMGSQVMSLLPVGFPKLLISTVAGHSGLSGIFDGVKDTVVINPVVDISGSNSILNTVLEEAAAIMFQLVDGYAQHKEPDMPQKPRVAISMWGVTTPCVEHVRERLESAGFEVYVFHANGMGGRMMETLIRDGEIHGVVDITLAELGNTLCGGNSSPTPDRLYAAAEAGIPVVLSVGGLDMISMAPPFDALPEKFRGRKEYFHEENVMFVRSNREENRLFGEEIARRLNTAKGETKVLLPLGGISANDKAGCNFFDPEADEALFCALEHNLAPQIEVIRNAAHINDPEFADVAAELMVEMMERAGAATPSKNACIRSVT